MTYIHPNYRVYALALTQAAADPQGEANPDMALIDSQAVGNG